MLVLLNHTASPWVVCSLHEYLRLTHTRCVRDVNDDPKRNESSVSAKVWVQLHYVGIPDGCLHTFSVIEATHDAGVRSTACFTEGIPRTLVPHEEYCYAITSNHVLASFSPYRKNLAPPLTVCAIAVAIRRYPTTAVGDVYDQHRPPLPLLPRSWQRQGSDLPRRENSPTWQDR